MTENRFSCTWVCVETFVPSLFPSKALILTSHPALQNHQPSSGKWREVARQSLWWQILRCIPWFIGKQLRGQCRQGRAECSPPLPWPQAHGLAYGPPTDTCQRWTDLEGNKRTWGIFGSRWWFLVWNIVWILDPNFVGPETKIWPCVGMGGFTWTTPAKGLNSEYQIKNWIRKM